MCNICRARFPRYNNMVDILISYETMIRVKFLRDDRRIRCKLFRRSGVPFPILLQSPVLATSMNHVSPFHWFVTFPQMKYVHDLTERRKMFFNWQKRTAGYVWRRYLSQSLIAFLSKERTKFELNFKKYENFQKI